MEGDKHKRISLVTAGFMIVVAVFFEVLEFLIDFIPVVGQILNFFIDGAATLGFWFWFKIKSVDMADPKAIKRFWIANFAEILPLPLVDLGLHLLGVILTIAWVWAEDKGGVVAGGAKLIKKRAATGSFKGAAKSSVKDAAKDRIKDSTSTKEDNIIQFKRDSIDDDIRRAA